MNNELVPIEQMLEMSRQQTKILETFKDNKEATDKQIQALNKKIDKRIDQMPIDGYSLGKLNNKRIKVCIDWMGGRDSEAYNHTRKRINGSTEYFNRKVYGEAGRDFKEKFNLVGGSYRDLKSEDYEAALAYWDEWEPSTNTKMEIKQLNNQLSLLETEENINARYESIN